MADGYYIGHRVWGKLKPTLEVTLTEGGSLAPNTTYYLVGMMGMPGFTYNAVGSPFSDVHTFTTTDTALSVTVSQKTYRTIQSFSDNGDGRTLVHCTRHCLNDVEDIIKIDSGSYAGSHNVDEWVDYHSYIINTPYIDATGVESYTDSTRYNHPTTQMNYSAAYDGMVYYLHTVYPYNADGEWIGVTNRYSRSIYRTDYTSNPAVIDIVRTVTCYGGNIDMLKIGRGVYKHLQDDGLVYISIDDAGSTPTLLTTELKAAGFEDNISVYTSGGYGYTDHMVLHATIRLSGSEAKFTANFYNITLLGGEICNYNSDYFTNVNFDRSFVSSVPGTFSAYISFSLTNGAYFNGAITNAIIGHIHGENATIYSTARLSASLGFNDYQEEYIELISGTPVNKGVIENKVYRPSSPGQYNQNSYVSISFRNSTITGTYMTLINTTEDIEYDKYLYQNVKIVGAPDEWDFRFYSYNQITTQKIKYLNVDTERPNNIKYCIHNSLQNSIHEFYRRVEFDTNVPGALITLNDDSGNIYTATTDENGYAHIDYLEQRTQWVNTDPTDSGWSGNADTYYNAVDFKITKEGYYDYTDTIEDFTDVNKNFNMTGIDPVFYPLPAVEIDDEPTTIAIVEIETE